MPSASELARQEEERAPTTDNVFKITRHALDEVDAALAGAIGALGDVANLTHAKAQLRAAYNSQGEHYNGR